MEGAHWLPLVEVLAREGNSTDYLRRFTYKLLQHCVGSEALLEEHSQVGDGVPVAPQLGPLSGNCVS